MPARLNRIRLARAGNGTEPEDPRPMPVVAVDVPSGVDVDGGTLDGPHVRADLTVTFGTHKVAHLVDPACLASGVLHLVDLGLDDADLGEPVIEALQRASASPETHQYPSNRGIGAFRGAVAGFYGDRFGVEIDPETEVIPVLGGKEGVAHVALACLDPGDVALAASGTAEVASSGAGTIIVTGNAACTIKATGSGEVVCGR